MHRPGLARVADPVVAEGYSRCAAITREHGTTYWWGARLLPAETRRHVHAVYALARLADDIVDLAGPEPVADTAAALDAFEHTFWEAVQTGGSSDPVMAAVATTVRERRIPEDCFARFFDAMRADLTRTTYETWADLLGYMDGSAAVIGEMMLPVLRPGTDAVVPARSLGLAFQLTNFLRDVAVDWRLDRVYLPGLPEDALRTRTATAAVRERVAHHVGHARALFAETAPATDALTPAMRPGIRVARGVYARVLDRVERNDYDVIGTRVALAPWEGVRAAAGSVFAPR